MRAALIALTLASPWLAWLGCSEGSDGQPRQSSASGDGGGEEPNAGDAGAFLATAGLVMLTTVTARSESEVLVHTELLVGGDESNTYVILEGGDHLIAEADGARVEMTPVEEGVYEATFESGAAGAEYRVLLMREPEAAHTPDAAASHGTLPAPFELTSELGSEPISRAQDLELTWAPSGSSDAMSIEVDDAGGSCIFADDFALPGDTGSYVLEAGSIESTSTQMPASCEVTATVIRERAGSTDAALDPESRFTLRQLRVTSFTSAP